MTAAVLTRAMRGLALAQIRHLTPAPPGAAGPLGDAVYRQVERDFGLIAPPVALHAPAPETMAACWLMLRETLIVPGLVGREVKEAVASAVSLANTCPYCVTVHTATLRGFAGRRAEAGIANRRIDDVPDPRLRAAARWAMADPDNPSPGRHAAPFPSEHRPEYVGVALTFHYINRMVNVFLEDAPMPASAPRRGLSAVKRVLSAMIRSAGRQVGEPGAGLALLPEAEIPRELDWAAANPYVAGALARAGAAIERAGRRSVPDSVRALVLTEVAGWDGQPRGANRSWIERPVAAVPPDDRAAARLALLTAMASYQVTDGLVDAYRAGRPEQSSLVELTSWSALAGARHAVGMPVIDEPRAAGRGAEYEG